MLEEFLAVFSTVKAHMVAITAHMIRTQIFVCYLIFATALKKWKMMLFHMKRIVQCHQDVSTVNFEVRKISVTGQSFSENLNFPYSKVLLF